ncbi:MAG TPA: LysM peptidoglycan-binding domain-containing protein [Anaerolineales bacterium]|nr:LysM peptidoglycan-binding domain-containing protein [Anaerolineales bacterium]
MKWEKKICIRISMHRLVGAILIAASSANLIIVGAAVESASSDVLTVTSSLADQDQGTARTVYQTMTLFAPTVTDLQPLTPASTSTETATPTWTVTSTETITPTATIPYSPTPTTCALKTYWSFLFVQSGDTLSKLARATGSTVDELMQANCLPDTRIVAGQLLYVPRPPFSPATLTATFSPVPPTETSIPTIFQEPSGSISQCSSQPYMYLSVLPFDPQGIKSVTAFYSINGDPWLPLSMTPDGETYFGSDTLSAEYSKIDSASYYFSALDGAGNFVYSNVFPFTFPPCQAG